MPVITALQAHKRDSERVKLYLDDAYVMDLPLLQAAGLQTGQCLSQPEVDALAADRALQKAYDRALRYLAYRPRSAAETHRYLLGKETPEAVTSEVVERLKQRGYLDDLEFARFWLENRSRFKPRAPRAIRYELWQKGVDAEVIEAVLAELDAAELAYRAASSQVSRHRGQSRPVFRHKLGAMLHRRGFDSVIISETLQRLQQELEESEEGYSGQDADDEHDWLE